MKRNLIIISAVVVVAVAGFFYWHARSQAAIGSLNIYSGDVDVLSGQNSQSGKTGLGIKAGDVLKVHQGSRVSIILKDGSVIRLEAGTEVSVAKLVYNGGKIQDAEFDVKTGRLWSHDNPLANGGNYQVETPTVVAAVRGTSYNTDYLNGTSTIYVYTHSVFVNLKSDPNSTKEVIAGDVFNISDSNAEADFNAGPVQAYPSFIDDWVDFNTKLDAALDGTTSPLAPSPESSSSTPASTTPEASPSPTPAPSLKPTPPPPQAPLGPTVTSLALTVVNPNVTAGQSTLLKVTAKYSDGSSKDAGTLVSWHQSSEIGTIKSPGYFTGVLSGTTDVTALLGTAVSNPVTIIVSGQSPAGVSLVNISVACQKTSSNSFTNLSLPHAQCTATGTYSNDTSADITSQVSWTARGTAGGSITSAGYYTPQNSGTITITANQGNISGNTTLSIP